MATKKVATSRLQRSSQPMAAAESRPAQSPASESSAGADAELLHELKVHQVRLEMENKELREALELHRIILDGVRDPLFVKDKDHKLLVVNRAFCDAFGLNLEAVIGRTLADHVPPNEREHFLAVDRAVLDSGLPNMCEESLTVGGFTRIIVTTKACIISPTGNKLLVGSIHDITERKRAEEVLRDSEERYRTLVEWTPEPIIVYRGGKLLYANPAAIRMFGANSSGELVGTSMLERVHPDSLQEITEQVLDVAEPGRNFSMSEQKLLKIDATVMDVEVRGMVISYDGESALQVAMRDITERKKMELQIRELAFYDPLTQLPNRRLLGDRLSQSLAESKRSNHYGALIFLDLDNFKSLNDQHGHAMGDMLLVQAAQRMRGCVREIDTVARHGGDEFVVMMVDLSENKAAATAQAGSLAEKIRTALAEPYLLAVKNNIQADALVEHRCTVSMGVVVFNDREGTQDDFLRLADSAMYQAKDEGSNLVRFSEVECRS